MKIPLALLLCSSLLTPSLAAAAAPVIRSAPRAITAAHPTFSLARPLTANLASPQAALLAPPLMTSPLTASIGGPAVLPPALAVAAAAAAPADAPTPPLVPVVPGQAAPGAPAGIQADVAAAAEAVAAPEADRTARLDKVFDATPAAQTDSNPAVLAAGAGRAETLAPAQDQFAVVTPEGVRRPLTYDPAAPRPSRWSRLVTSIRSLPETMRRARAYTRRVDELVSGIKDEELAWSLNRLDALKTQEGILRINNDTLVNRWQAGPHTREATHRDFDASSLSWNDIAYLFKQSMDREEPTQLYQFTSAHNIHNHLPRVSHFMGTTLNERILQVALKGRAGQPAIWSREENRHGPIMERVWNQSRAPDRPALSQQGISTKQPVTGAYSAKSMMANRALAEIGAAMAYLTIKANARKDSPTDLALDGIYRDEVYHYVLMRAANVVAYKQRSRWHHLLGILRHYRDYPTPDAADAALFERRPSLLMMLESAYAFMAIDKRVDRYIKKIPAQQLADLVGPVYPTDKALAEAIARGEHTWTQAARTEQNPELTLAEVEELIRRFPGAYSIENRAIRSSTIRAVIDDYRSARLTKPSYWTRRNWSSRPMAGGSASVSRTLEKSPGHEIVISFPAGASPVVSVGPVGGAPAFSSSLDDMSMLQIGAVMDADGLDLLERLEKAKGGLSDAEILLNLNRTPRYQAAPIRLIED